jgi:subtilase family serine protease
VVEAVEARVFLSAVATPTPILLHPDSFPIYRRPIFGSGGATQSPAGQSSASAVGGLSVTQVRGAYGLGPVGSSNISFNGVVGDGTGQTIAIVDAYNDPNIATDLATFDTAEGLSAPPSFTVVGQTGSTSSLPSNSATSGSNDWSGEESLDVEWAHAIAPGASLVLVECNSSYNSDLFTGVVTAASYAGVAVVSNSYGGSETSSESTFYDPSFTTPSGHSGVTFFASTGDTGGSVEYPAQSPNVVAVGGTQLTVSGSSWSSETAWNNGGGGTSAYESQPSYQAGTITASKRETPDVSIAGGQNSGASNSYVPVVDSWDNSSSAPWIGLEGTSWSSPMMAGLVAIADQGRVAEGLSTLNSSQTLTRLYQLAKANFHDITTGSNGHSAVAGYDEATGIGTPIGNLLVPDLAGTGTITGRVFVDTPGTGTYVSGDPTLSGRTVYLDLNNDGVQDNSEPTAVTNSSGGYMFTDQPAGGSVRLSNANISGYGLTSAASATLVYGPSETVNFTYQVSSKLVISTQPPASTPYGTSLASVVVNVDTSANTTVYGDSSTVTLTLNTGTFNTGSSTITATAVNGVATFTGLRTSTVGSYTLTASDGSLSTATSNSFSIVQATPTLSWTAPASITYGTALSSTQLNATASVPGTLVYSPASGTVLSAGAGQTLHVTFTPTDTTDYTSASGSTTITVLQVTPTVSWSTPSSIVYGTALSSTQLNATASVPGTFTYTPALGTVLTVGTQSLNVVFHPTDSIDYSNASGSTSIVITQATPIVTWANPASITYGTALSATQLNATASVPGTFVYTPASGTVLAAGLQTLNAVFHPTDTTDYKTANGSASLTVLQATPTITWASPSPISYGTALSSTQLNASTGVPGTFVYSPSAGTVLGAGAGQALHVTFTPTDTTDYTSASASTSITVNKVTPSISWASPSSISYGTALSGTQLNATTSVPGSFAYTPAAGTVLTAGNNQTLGVTFTPTDTADYNTASGSTTINVLRVTPTVSWSAPSSIVYGTALGSTQLDATANVPGTFVYTPAAGTILSAGTARPLSVSFTPTDTTDYASVNGSTSITVTQATPSLSWIAPASIVYGTALTGTQLDASANVPGTFVYTPAPGTILGVGNARPLSVSFTPTDTTDYTNANASTSITVTQATPAVSWSAPASIPYGTALGGTQLNATANVPGTFVYTPAAGTILGVGSDQSLSVSFTPTDTTDYAGANASTNITVTQATPTISWSAPSSIVYGTALSATQLDATASVPGTFVYTPAVGTVLGAGSGQTLSVSFTPTDSADYTNANGSTSITVAQASPIVSWSAPASIAYPTPLSGTQLDATANVPGTFSYNPSSGTVLYPGANQSLGVVFTPTDSTDYSSATASTQITVTGTAPAPISLTGSSFYVKLDNASPQNLDIWTNATAAGAPAQVTAFNSVSSIALSANANGDTFVADFSNGSIIPSGGLSFAGSGVAANNSLTIVGTGGSDTVTVPGDGNVHINGQLVAYSAASIGNIYFAPGGSGESLTIPSSTVTLAPGVGAGVNTSTFNSINIGSGAEFVVPLAASHANRTLVQTTSLSLAGSSGAWTGLIDLSNNDLDVTTASLSDLTSQIAQAYATGTAGITSSAGIADATHLTTLGVIQNGGGDVLVKYTYFGDANTNGTVDSTDYTLIDNGYLQHLAGWGNGDFNYDGTINGSDYTLIDNAFNQQGASLAAQIAPAVSKAAAASVFSQTQLAATPSTSGSEPPATIGSVAASIFDDDQLELTRAKRIKSR